ncbi:hypothetical protein MKX01_031348 [Papaver californicum]|nr:hypothetical protein MKX01_031348 [Papaver californicum]
MIPINLTEMSFSIINDVICKLRGILQVTQDIVAGAATADIFPWMGWIHRFDGIDTVYESIIDEHLEPHKPSPKFEDFVDVLLRLQKDPNQSISFCRDQIKGLLTVRKPSLYNLLGISVFLSLLYLLGATSLLFLNGF